MTNERMPIDETRDQPRLKLPAMYTLLRARLAGSHRYRWTGHIYDISVLGMRFELDEPLVPGTEVEIRGMLPGARHTTFGATGQIVRQLDDEERIGPFRMAIAFDTFSQHIDRQHLCDYLSCSGLRAA